MGRVDARNALGYAFSREMLKLYGVLLLADFSLLGGGWLLANWAVRGGTAGLLGQVLGSLLLLAGFLIGVAGLVAFIYKVIADAAGRED